MKTSMLISILIFSSVSCFSQLSEKKKFGFGISMSAGAQVNYSGNNSTILNNARLLGEGRTLGISASYRFHRRVDARLSFCGNRQSLFAYLDNGDIAYLRVQSLRVPLICTINRPFTPTAGAYIGFGGCYEFGDVTQTYNSNESSDEFNQVGILGALGLALSSEDQKYRGFIELEARQDVSRSLISRGSLNVGIGFEMFLF